MPPGCAFVMLACSVPAFGAFAAHQRRRRQSGRMPLVELRVFGKRSYSSGVLFALVFFGAVAGISLSIGLLLQIGLGYSPVHASLASATWAIGAFPGTGASAALTPRIGRTAAVLGTIFFSLIGAGTATHRAASLHAAQTTTLTTIAVTVLAFGLGFLLPSRPRSPAPPLADPAPREPALI